MNIAQLAIDAIDRFGEYELSYFEGAWRTNVQQLRSSCALATVLLDKGVQPGDRVVVLMKSCPEVTHAFHAVARIGAVIVPLTPQLIAPEIRYIVENSGAQTVVTSPEMAPKMVEATQGIEGFRQILVFGETNQPGCENIAGAVDQAEPLGWVCERDDDDLAVLVYTSGTTGHPKGVMLSHGNVISNARSVASLYDHPTDQRSMMVLPMSHVYGILLINLGALMGGVGTMMRQFDPGEALRTIEEFRVERCCLVPTMLVLMLNHPDRDKHDYSSLEVVSAGSAPLSNELRLDFEKAFGCRVADGYGQSEATCAITAYRDEDDIVPGSVGRPLPDIELAILDDDNQPLPPNTTGEVCIQGPNVMQGYWNNEEATRAAIVDGWLHTGDVGHVDENGYLYITDRKKDIIIKGAENIAPREIENAIYPLPGVAEVSVYGVPDDTFQEEIAASIVLKSGAKVTADEVRDQAGRVVTKFKIPKYVRFHDALPKNSNGKILKRALREQWEGGGGLS
ncbi:MAG: class I adenylate-forming enzyme family protein [Planctomycetota bacterium]